MKCVQGGSRSTAIPTELSSRLVLTRPSTAISRTLVKPPWKRPEQRKINNRGVPLFCAEAGITKTVTELPELKATNFYEFLKDTEAELVVVDFYTDWCGPCKLIYPELVLMQEQYRQDDVLFVQFNCNKENKSIGKELNIKVAPTFFLYKQGEKVAEMTGAKTGQLRELIKQHL